MYSLVNKTVIITGGVNGVGASIVKEFLKENVKYIAILDIEVTSGIKFEKEILSTYREQKANFFKCDVTNAKELFALFNKIAEQYGTIDIVINNAGIAYEGLDNFKSQVEVNYTAVVSSTLKALDLMRLDKGGKGGTIINIISPAALTIQSPSFSVYGATKSAVLQFTTCIGLQGYYTITNVRVFSVCLEASSNEIHRKQDSYEKSVNSNCITKAAQGVIYSYKNGESGSTWLINDNKIDDITPNIRRAYKIMSTKASQLFMLQE